MSDVKLDSEELNSLIRLQTAREAQALALENANLKLEVLVLKLSAKYGFDITKTPIKEDGTFEFPLPSPEIG